MKFSPGTAVPRTEDRRLLTGGGRYSDDITLPAQAYAALVRSPHAHAAILSIDTEAAAEAPGVLAVLTAADWQADGMGGLWAPGHPLKAPLRRPDGQPFANPNRPALAADRVAYVGEAVALVVAETPAQAADAAEMVAVDYDPLPAVAEVEAAIAPDAPLVRDDTPRNIVFAHDFGDPAATEAAFRDAPRVQRQRLVVNRVHANPMETRSVNGLYDAREDRFTIWCGVHRPFELRDMLADHVFRIAPDRLDIVPGDLGGSFGLKGSYPVEVALMPWASRRLGRPVKWTATRSEMIIADNHARDVVAVAELAYDDAGRFLAIRSRNLSNMGAYVEYYGAAPALMNVGGTVGPYAIPVAHVQATGVLTHTTPTTAYRGAGRPEATYIIERLIDLAAADLGLDPAEMRRRNLIAEDAFPYRTALTFTYDCGQFEQVLDKALAAADYAGFPARRQAAAERGLLRGIGLSMSIESSAAIGREFVELRFDADGGVTVLAGSTNHGQGHETVFAQFLVARLGIDPDLIRVVESDTRQVRSGGGTGGSRSAAYNAAAVDGAIRHAIDAGLPLAARLLQTDAARLTFADGAYRIAETGQSVAFAEVVRASHADRGPGLRAEAAVRFDAPAFPNGCQVCEVEIDPATGIVEIVRHSVCDDVGYEINPLIVKGQLMGGIAQGLGQALMENLVLDAEGQVLSGSFMDYAMPRATDFGRARIVSHPVPTGANPLGVKGVGESGTVGALAAAMNALNHALSTLGVRHLDMPATPARVWQAIRAAAR